MIDKEDIILYDTIIEDCISSFRSGNEIPITRNTVTRNELYYLIQTLVEDGAWLTYISNQKEN